MCNQAEIQLLRGDSEDDHPLTENELKSLQKHVQNYIDDASCEATLNVGGDISLRAHGHAVLYSVKSLKWHIIYLCNSFLMLKEILAIRPCIRQNHKLHLNMQKC